jgi:hypothetical protein
MQNTKTGKAINIQGENAVWVSATDSTSIVFEPGTLYVGSAGTVVLLPFVSQGADTTTNNAKVTFPTVPAGTILPVLTRRVIATGTTATGFVIIY